MSARTTNGGVPHMTDEELARLFRRLPIATLAERIHSSRLVVNATRASLSRASGIHTETIARLERGEVADPRENTLMDIARGFTALGLGVNTAWLMWGADGPPELTEEAGAE